MSRLPAELVQRVEEALRRPILSSDPIGGGCIANATRLKTAGGDFFLKWSGGEAASTFAAEAEGLRALREAGGSLRVPEVIAQSDSQGETTGFLILEFVEAGKPGRDFWTTFGAGLADLHRHEGDVYGFSADNYIGRLPQENTPEESWPEFFRQRRLEPQVRMARERGRWNEGWTPALDRLYAALPEMLPYYPERSVLHGDLWSGNFMVDSDGRPVLVDPATYFGHRETDLAMAELFGGFDGRFFESYRDAWPLTSGYEDRRAIYQLYHLINHLNHFGGGYAGGVDSTLRRF